MCIAWSFKVIEKQVKIVINQSKIDYFAKNGSFLVYTIRLSLTTIASDKMVVVNWELKQRYKIQVIVI